MCDLPRRPRRPAFLAAIATTVLAALLAPMLGTPAAVASAHDPADETDRYIVVLDPATVSAETIADTHVRKHHGELIGVYKHAFSGYSAHFTQKAVEELRKMPNVVSVERDAEVVEAWDQGTPTGVSRIFAPDNPNLRIDAADNGRVNVDIAIVDTGVAAHPDLNIVSRTDCSSGRCVDNSGDDGNGHGTHVAGTAAAIDNNVGVVGVAPGARIHSVKVLDDQGSGSLSAMAAGMDWVAGHAGTIETANLSLGCAACSSAAVSTAISNSVRRGVVVVAAAGNSGADAAGFFPANHPDVITVSSINDTDGRPGGRGPNRPPCRTEADNDDSLAFNSNYGRTVEIAAPGMCIRSTWTGGGYNVLSGTSMATPHVTGAAALLAAGAAKPTDRDDVLAVRQTLIRSGNRDWTDDAPDGVKEPLLDVHDPRTFGANGR